jgi:microcystin-dependent protein
MKTLVLILLANISIGIVHAQVGFGNPVPDPSSILDLTANDKGFLIPRMSQAQREAIVVAVTPARSLLVFDTTLGMFFFYDGGTWYSLNEWVRTAGSSTVTLTGSATITGTMTASNYALNSNGNGPVPAGGIIMWSGSIASIPTGWALCNGANGTPNLQDRFIVGAGSSYGVGTPGGQDMVTLTTNELPSHTHTVVAGSGAHTHTVTGQTGGDNNDHSNGTTVGAGDKGSTETGFNFSHTTSSSGSHVHTLNSTGNGQAFDNRPLYFALAYIMKLP